MNPLIQKVLIFFNRRVREASRNTLVDFALTKPSVLATFTGTEHRFKGHSVGQFLDARWEVMKPDKQNTPGGIWLSDRALFDFTLRVETDGDGVSCIHQCDCGFYAIIDDADRSGNGALEVALRYEADFINIGTFWADHPSHHLQWDRPKPRASSGASETRLRVEPMLPTHFLEFCTRHYFPGIWTMLFAPHTTELRDLTERLNTEINAADEQDHLALVNTRRAVAQEYTTKIKHDCRLGMTYKWAHNEVVELPI